MERNGIFLLRPKTKWIDFYYFSWGLSKIDSIFSLFLHPHTIFGRFKKRKLINVYNTPEMVGK